MSSADDATIAGERRPLPWIRRIRARIGSLIAHERDEHCDLVPLHRDLAAL